MQPTVKPAENRTAANEWESAYLRFETPEQEIRKFSSRLKKLGVASRPRTSEVVELFCGRGNGLHALKNLGFTKIQGVDLSARLVAEYRGPAQCVVADCRHLPFSDRCKDILIVQGGLHHLPLLPSDLDATFQEMRRVLRTSGWVVFVEPWLTPFLKFVHLVCGNPVARQMSNKIDALETMIEHERETYERWLSQPELVRNLAFRHFSAVQESRSMGKWSFVGTPRTLLNPASKIRR